MIKASRVGLFKEEGRKAKDSSHNTAQHEAGLALRVLS